MSPLRSCPTCGSQVPDEAIDGPAVRTTGEFAVVSPAELARVAAEGDAAPPAPIRPRVAKEAVCAWCGKGRADVRKLLSGPNVHICDGCIAFCAMILKDELGPKWAEPMEEPTNPG